MMKDEAAKSPNLIDLREIEGAFDFAEGFSRPDWNVIRKAIAQRTSPENLNSAWIEAATQWLLRLQADLGGEYRLDVSREFLLLSALDRDVANPILALAERALEQIQSQLGKAAWRPGAGKHVILLFSDDDDYYQYVSFFWPEGT